MRTVAPLLIHPARLLVTLALSTALAVSVVPVVATPPAADTGHAAPGSGASASAAFIAPGGPAGEVTSSAVPTAVAGTAGPVDGAGSPAPAFAPKPIVDEHGAPVVPRAGLPNAAPATGPAAQSGALASMGKLGAATAATVAGTSSGSADTITGATLADRNEQLVVAVLSGTDQSATGYPLHTNIVSTTFWVGEIFNANLSDGSQVCSTYDGQWAFHYTGITSGITPAAASGCAGSAYGGCDGVSSGTGTAFRCATEARSAANGFLPTRQPAPLQNAFYLDLPFDDVNDPTAFATRCTIVPWAATLGLSHCADPGFSYLKNRWVRIVGPNGHVCYGQIEDAGPSSGALYHDAGYVFGSTNARPVNLKFSGDSSQGAGMDVSPALNGCLGFTDLDGDADHVDWSFTERADVPPGPWLRTVTTSQVSG
ncbi:hypothetical protein [Cryobacterium zhongshanensis]|uniref:Uncharacterized protein n=1 Tax=Cryobacterium zhongshanensis TaxID=2928153 RepID=A0AA41UKP6_9MICO|nr:hypothetical protein [Cryobacterium zhongshanensis]MCI4658131.1 hypothetical protein [Cryobacterium zhongshanensis]